MYSSIFLYQAMVKAKCVWHSLRNRERWCLSLQTLLISSIFFNLWHTFARWRQMWHSSASFVSFLVHGELQVSGWLLCEMIKLRHKVPPAFCEIWLTCETCESWEQVAGWDRHTDTRFPAKSSTHDQPETQLHRNSTQHQSKMEHGWNMDGTWMEHGWNMDGT